MIIDKLHPILRRFRAPEPGDDGSGGSEDRGDNWTPSDDTDNKGDVADEKPDADKDDGGDDKSDTDAKKDDDDKKDDADDKKDDADDKKDDADDKKDDKKGDKKDRKDDRVPMSRHKAILQKEREAREEAERKLAQYEGGNRIAVINDAIKKAEDKVLELDKQYSKLVTDGEHEKAASVMREIRGLERDIAEQKGDLKAQAASSKAVEQMRYDITVERLEAAYPVLNPDHEDHDEEVAQDVMDLAATYRARRGMAPAQAIQKAAEKLLGTSTKKQEEATQVKARVDKEEAEAAAAKEAKDKGTQKDKEAERRKEQVKKNLDANKNQPADTTKRGADSDKAGGGVTAKDVLKMSQDDFNKLDDETLARMRGDTIGA